jgi:hypothetical protein
MVERSSASDLGGRESLIVVDVAVALGVRVQRKTFPWRTHRQRTPLITRVSPTLAHVISLGGDDAATEVLDETSAKSSTTIDQAAAHRRLLGKRRFMDDAVTPPPNRGNTARRGNDRRPTVLC